MMLLKLLLQSALLISTNNDTNGNRVIDKSDYAQFLSFIPTMYSNHSPTFKESVTNITNQTIGVNQDVLINLDTIFKDVNEDYLNYRLYLQDNSPAIPAVAGEFPS
jgi:hypothetical protein